MSLKNITLSANEKLIELAREKAMKEKTTLNKVFREWLMNYVGHVNSANTYQKLMQDLKYVKVGKHFDRDELNER